MGVVSKYLYCEKFFFSVNVLISSSIIKTIGHIHYPIYIFYLHGVFFINFIKFYFYVYFLVFLYPSVFYVCYWFALSRVGHSLSVYFARSVFDDGG